MEQFDIENLAEMMPSYLLSGIPGAMYYAYYYTKNCGQVGTHSAMAKTSFFVVLFDLFFIS